MAKHMHSREFDIEMDSLILKCDCGWEGKPMDAFNESYSDVIDFECPKCETMLLIVNKRENYN